MSSKSAQITQLIEQASPHLAVIFAGNTMRLIGTLDHPERVSAAVVKPEVDAMLIGQNLSATYISLATCHGAAFIACHS